MEEKTPIILSGFRRTKNDEELASLKVSELYAGIDQAGVQIVAGPMVSAVVVLPHNHGISDLPTNRTVLENQEMLASLSQKIFDTALHVEVFYMNPEQLDTFSGFVCRKELWRKCIQSVRDVFEDIEVFINDSDSENLLVRNQMSVENADLKFPNVSAASIVAKAWLEHQFVKLEEAHPGYGFVSHKGLPTETHLDAIQKLGFSPAHRATIVRKWIERVKASEVVQKEVVETPTPPVTEEKVPTALSELKSIVNACLSVLKDEPSFANDWEKSFLNSMFAKLKIGASPKGNQEAQIRKIFQKIWEKVHSKTSVKEEPQVPSDPTPVEEVKTPEPPKVISPHKPLSSLELLVADVTHLMDWMGDKLDTEHELFYEIFLKPELSSPTESTEKNLNEFYEMLLPVAEKMGYVKESEKTLAS